MRRLALLLTTVLLIGCSQATRFTITTTPLSQVPSVEQKKPTSVLPEWSELSMPPHCTFGAISPNLKWLAYTCLKPMQSGSAWQGWLAQVESGQLYRPASVNADLWLGFTPDSSYAIGADLRGQDIRWRLFSLSASLREREILSDTQQLLLGSAIWSPDGSVMAACDYSCSQIYLLDPTNWHSEQIVDAPGQYSAQYSWSPDGRELVYIWGDSLADDKSVSVRITNRQTRQSRILMAGSQPLTGVSWSPTGKWVAIRAEGMNKTVLSLIDPQSDDKYELTYDEGSATRLNGWRDLVWSPDGSRLALRDGLIIEVPSGQIIRAGPYSSPLAWSADSESLLVSDYDVVEERDVLRWLLVRSQKH